jgi:N-methylhydantoinase A/oxoprolinase/acetone carboxylase beta subunit
MAAPDWEFLVFSEHGKTNFFQYQEALDYAVTLGETTVLDYMKEAGLDSNHIKIDVKKEEIIPLGWKTPMETKLVVLGVGNRNSTQDCC